MKVQLRLSPRVALVAALLLLSFGARAGADSATSFMAAALGGIGGSPDVKPSQSYANPGFQLDLNLFVDPQQWVGIKVGELDLNAKPSFGSLEGARLTYADVGGEYRFEEPYYESGIFIGLGAYRLAGTSLFGGSNSSTAIGGVFGLTGEFRFTQAFGLLIELSGHYVDFRDQHIYVMGHAGLAYHF